jgi:hypothetical protein
VKPRPKVGRQRGRGKSKPDFEKILGESHRPMISRQRKSGESSAVRALGIPRRLPPSRAVDFSATKIRRILGCSSSGNSSATSPQPRRRFLGKKKSGESSAVRALGIPRRLPPSRAVDFSATKIRRILGCSASWLIKVFLGEVLPRRAVDSSAKKYVESSAVQAPGIPRRPPKHATP